MQVSGIGPKNAKIVLVGEAPGEDEDREGTPFIGRAGKLLNKLMLQANITRDTCYITNVFKFRPPYNNIKIWLDISKKKIKETSEYFSALKDLKDELSLIDCNIIVALGQVPLYALCGIPDAITKRRGSIYESTLLPGKKVIATIHPASALRGQTIKDENMPSKTMRSDALIYIDLVKAKKESNFPEIKRLQRTLITDPSYNEVIKYIDRIKSSKPFSIVAFDTEGVTEISHLSIATSSTSSMSIPFYSAGVHKYSELEEANIWLSLAQIFEDNKIKKLVFNAMFDNSFVFREYGIQVKNFDDLMIVFSIVYPDYPKSLNFVTSIYSDMPYYKDEFKVNMSLYNAKDSIVLHDIYCPLMEDLGRIKNTKPYRQRLKLVEPLIYMQEVGMNIDIEGIKQELEIKEKEREVILEQLRSHGYSDSPSSPAQIMHYFYVKKGIKPYINRKTHKPTSDETALKRLAQHGYIEAVDLLKLRELDKYISTYLKVKIDEDNRLRCSWDPVGTSQGRLSSRKTLRGTGLNFQNIPK